MSSYNHRTDPTFERIGPLTGRRHPRDDRDLGSIVSDNGRLRRPSNTSKNPKDASMLDKIIDESIPSWRQGKTLL